ncbi:gluconokinase [Streptomyces sp. NPDC097619]|uniref:gluconokinase n=1 Tax=Streptomyces sp. NPDC097619 TaxID=3157228 RepID=UPI003327D015
MDAPEDGTGRDPRPARPAVRPERPDRRVTVVVTGVSGSGKTTLGRLLAEALDCAYAEADAFHPAANLARMAAGIPLDDAAREPWLRALGDRAARAEAEGRSLVLTCSALKRSYRDLLRSLAPGLRLVYLRGSRELIAERLAARTGHFFPAALLDSQFADLEEPAPEERAVVLDPTLPPEELVRAALAALAAR